MGKTYYDPHDGRSYDTETEGYERLRERVGHPPENDKRRTNGSAENEGSDQGDGPGA